MTEYQRRAFLLGWADGRRNKAVPGFPEKTNKAYNEGWFEGECAREEYENGCGWREDEGYHYMMLVIREGL